MKHSILFQQLSTAIAFIAVAQAQTSNLISTPRANRADGDLYLAVPAGANASAGDSKGGAGLFGVQLWQRDKSFISGFASVGAEQTVTQNFGGYVLNPSNEGSSFQIAGHYVRPIGPKEKAWLYWGGSLRSAWTLSNWKVASTQPPMEERGVVTSVSPALRIATRTFEGPVPAGSDSQPDEYQFAFEIGPTWRSIGGDVAQSEKFLQSEQVLGTSKSIYAGLEWTVSFRVNAWQPFARFTWIPSPEGKPIRGLTGSQVVIGVNVASALFKAKIKN